ncbi:unnamed protein product [Ceutorhynchus assimilis]|uniref:MYCBP-associated protein n=1 Tax=Ceutorhynchus assimilis TaxID=467358 RepID=A0A9N9MLN8_9CUCU|nr:unnamed protein product [Ceutorhynchus assimilis]
MCDIGCKGCNSRKCADPLKNWRLWLKRRQQMHQKLTTKLGCLPGELLMNSAENCRRVKEEQLVLRYTQIEDNFDKYRGDPIFWKLPPCFKSHVPPFKDTEYFLTRFKEEKNEIPELEYIGVPSAIMDEKDIRPRTRHLRSLWTESTYRQRVLEMVSEKLLKIEPHKPILSDLIIIGNKIGAETNSEPETSSIPQEKPKANKNETKVKEIKHADSIVTVEQYNAEPSLKINNKEFDKYTAHVYKENKISVIFEHFTDSLVPSKKSIVFENTGNVTIRLYWNYFKKFKAFMDYDTDEEINFHPFRFEKNEICLIPGTKKELLVCFQVHNPGNYSEYWEITSLPNVWTPDFRLLIHFQGFAVIRNYEERINELNEKLQYKMRNTAIKEVLNNIISSGIYCKPTAKQYFNFTEKDLFESANLVTRCTSKYVYNAPIISELKQFYQENKSLNDPDEWDLSIQKLGEIARKKDLLSYFDRKLLLFKKAKLRREALQNNRADVQGTKAAAVKENNKQITEKTTKEVSRPNSQPDDEIQPMICYKNLSDVLRKLEKPSIYINKEREKYLFSYIVLKTFFSKISNELDKLDSNNSQEIKDNNIVNKNDSNEKIQYRHYDTVPERILYEIFDERYILRTKRLSHPLDAVRAKPKSVLLTSVSLSDIKKVHKMYFNKDEATLKGTIKEKGQVFEDKKSNVLKGQKGKTQTNQEEDLFVFIKEDFDPFYETFPQFETMEQTICKETITPILAEEINKDKYLIVYKTLCEAVDALEDTIEALKDRSISSNTLSELLKCDSSFRQTASKKISIVNTSKKYSANSTRSTITSEKALPKESEEYSAYLEFLKDLHWQNNSSVKQHFLNEQKPKIIELPEKRIESELYVESQVKRSISNIFSLEDFKRKIEPYCLKDRFTQTELLENLDEDVDAVEKETIDTASEESLEKPRNMFYFLCNPGEKKSDILD